MGAWTVKQDSILKIVGKDGPIMREMRKPQIKYVPHKDYGLKKLYARNKRRSPVRR